LRILHLLGGRELCVCEVVAALGEPQYKISRHLGALREAGILKGRREGTWMHYAIDWSLDSRDLAVVRMALAASVDDPTVAADAAAVASLAKTPPPASVKCGKRKATR
jgi:ArsR family transcriptional regulator